MTKEGWQIDRYWRGRADVGQGSGGLVEWLAVGLPVSPRQIPCQFEM